MTSAEGTALSELIDAITQLYSTDKGPFPYADCRKIFAQFGEPARDLIPDLALYFATLAGYCSRGYRIGKMSSTEIAKARSSASRSFFALHPEYEVLSVFITNFETPYLLERLNLYEKMRTILLMILERMESHAPGIGAQSR
jgi:hypothetical protein